jgi:hypothetical protein
MKSYKEIIDETVEYYAEDPDRRGIAEDGTCVYDNGAGGRCAVGRCMTEEALEYLRARNLGGTADYVVLKLQDAGITPFKEEYPEGPIRFWLDLQHLHDSPIQWRGHAKVVDIAARAHAKWDSHPLEAPAAQPVSS